MTHESRDDGDWFAPKRFGYGAGLPIAWQGWAVLAAYVAVLAGAGFLIQRHTAGYVAIVIAATVALIVVAKRHTRGGWKWRSGEE